MRESSWPRRCGFFRGSVFPVPLHVDPKKSAATASKPLAVCLTCSSYPTFQYCSHKISHFVRDDMSIDIVIPSNSEFLLLLWIIAKWRLQHANLACGRRF